MPDFNARHLLKLFLRHIAKPLLFEVRQGDVARLEQLIDVPVGITSRADGFFWFDTVDGRSIVVNTAGIQAIHFLWEPTELPMDLTRHDGSIEIYLRDRDEKLDTWCASPDRLYYFFADLQNSRGDIPFLGFEDEDGEKLMFRTEEIVMVQAPLDYLDEGRRMADEQDGLGA